MNEHYGWKSRKEEELRLGEGQYIDELMMVGLGRHPPSPYSERQGGKPESRSTKQRDTGWHEGSSNTYMGWLTSDREKATKIFSKAISLPSTDKSDGNKRSHSEELNTVIMHTLDGLRPQIGGPTLSNTLVQTSCMSRVVCNSEQD